MISLNEKDNYGSLVSKATICVLILFIFLLKCTDPSAERVAFVKSVVSIAIEGNEENLKEYFCPIEFLLESINYRREVPLDNSQIKEIKKEYYEERDDVVRKCISALDGIDYRKLIFKDIGNSDFSENELKEVNKEENPSFIGDVDVEIRNENYYFSFRVFKYKYKWYFVDYNKFY